MGKRKIPIETSYAMSEGKMREDDESWKLLNQELRAARDAASVREPYPARTRFDQSLYDRLSSHAWLRYRQRVEQRRRAAAAASLPAEAAAVRFAVERADTVPQPLR